jgi:hypothetical protein
MDTVTATHFSRNRVSDFWRPASAGGGGGAGRIVFIRPIWVTRAKMITKGQATALSSPGGGVSGRIQRNPTRVGWGILYIFGRGDGELNCYWEVKKKEKNFFWHGWHGWTRVLPFISQENTLGAWRCIFCLAASFRVAVKPVGELGKYGLDPKRKAEARLSKLN